jgi:heme exporter protein B
LIWLESALAIFTKDVRSEVRTRTALNAILLFAVTTMTVVSFSTAGVGLTPEMHASLFWIILFFAAMAGLSRTFVVEAEKGTELALKLSASGAQVFMGKFLFNLALLGLLNGILIPLFQVFLPFPEANWALLLVSLGLGSVALAASATFVAAIVSQAGVKGALFTVLAFPVLVPVLFAGVGALRKAMTQQSVADASTELQLLVSYAGVMITLAFLMFDFVWRE